MAVELREVQVEGVRIAYRWVDGDGEPVVFVHGNPTDSRQWLPFLDRVDRPAIALDLPGFGASERPPADRFDYTMHGLAGTFGAFLGALGIGSYRLVVQDWGALALIAAAAEPDWVSRLVVLNSVPLLPGYHWHRTARMWRRRRVGELQLRSLRRPLVALGLREARPRFRTLPPSFVDMVWSNLGDRRTQPAILALYRSADPPALAAAGERLAELRCPALVIWGGADPYLAPRFGTAYAERLPDAELVVLDDAGHWAWLDRPDVVERTVAFLSARGTDLDSQA